MNFNFYIFGTPEGRYSQYPNDYTASTLTELLKSMQDVELAIYREMNLMHYVFAERLDGNHLIGFCLIFNNVRLQKPKGLINLCRFIVEKQLVNNGAIYGYDSNGNLSFRVKNLNECTCEYDRLKNLINIELEHNAPNYGIEPLTTTYNGTQTTGTIGEDASDAQIVALTQQHNKVVVTGTANIEHGLIPQLVASLRSQVQELTKQNAALKQNIAKQNIAAKQNRKKLYPWFMFLSVFVVACIAGLYVLNENLSNKDKELPLWITNIEIGNVTKNGDIETDYGKDIYSSNTMYLKPRIEYVGIATGEIIDISVKWYEPNGFISTRTSSSGSFSYSLYIRNGRNTCILPGWGNDNRGYWKRGSYRIELWYKDICLKTKSFTIY